MNHHIRTTIYTLATVAAMICSTFITGCRQGQQASEKESVADSLIEAADAMEDPDYMKSLCDSLQQTGDISFFKATFHRGSAYVTHEKFRSAENEFKQVLTATPGNHRDSLYYYESIARLVEVYIMKQFYEGALHTGLPVMEDMKRMVHQKQESSLIYSVMIMAECLGAAQYNLGMKEDAMKSLEISFEYGLLYDETVLSSEPVAASLTQNILLLMIGAEDYETAEKWLPRMDSLASIIAARQDVSPERIDRNKCNEYFIHGSIAYGMGNPEEARRAYEGYKSTHYAQTRIGRLNGGDYLLRTGRYAEAADAYVILDSIIEEFNLTPTLYNIGDFTNKFTANYKAGRRDSALVAAARAFEYYDEAVTHQKQSDAAELATIYETQQKDAEIARQQIELTQQRLWGMVLALVLLTAFFVVYTIIRHRHAKRLAEMKAEQERIESELRIARDIQMSMVPNDFPEHERLDMYAEMNPAKEVGGDLYGYVLQDNKLYFCVGDVSGKGVPASLFMSQSARLFRTLATEGLSPIDIATRMNNELAENNERGMFVTMFIGLLHLDTGRLDFCNCGHNPPVLDGQFMTLEHDNAPLGLWEDDPFFGETIDDIRGRQLLIYTDGLNEAENKQQQLLGNDRLIEMMANAHSMTSHEVIDMLKAAVEKHRDGAEPNDDLTLMCLKLRK